MLITKQEIATHREISRGVKDDKINPFISDAEFLDVRPLLGDKLYHDLIGNVAEAHYEDLLDEKTYTYDGVEYTSPGLKKVLAIYAYSRYVLFGSFTDTAFGFVQKNTSDSTAVGDSQKRNIYTQERNTAYNYWLEVAAFLSRNKDDYEFWDVSSCGTRKRSGIKISKIS